MNCPYCKKPAKWVENKIVYGRNYGKSYMIWWCPCGAYVGCHQNTQKPKGTMANAELRAWRIKAHAVIDPLWKNGEMKCWEVYRMLNDIFGKEIHIGESDIKMCQEIIDYFNPQKKFF